MSLQVDFAVEWLKVRRPYSVAYIGWRHDTNCAPLVWCKDNHVYTTIIEAYAPNALCAVERGHTVVTGRIDQLVSSRQLGAYSCALWLHGPEHVDRDTMWYTLGGLISRCPRVLIQAPIGDSPQGVYGGNPYEVHQQSLLPRDFYSMGWQTEEHRSEQENTFSAWVDG